MSVLVVLLAFVGCGSDEVTPEPTGQWGLLSRGTTDRFEWSIYATAATPNGSCLSIESTPSYSRFLEGRRYRGRSLLGCGFEPGTEACSPPISLIDVRQGTQGPFPYVLALLPKSASDVRVRTADGLEASPVVAADESGIVFVPAADGAVMDSVVFAWDGDEYSCPAEIGQPFGCTTRD